MLQLVFIIVFLPVAPNVQCFTAANLLFLKVFSSSYFSLSLGHVVEVLGGKPLLFFVVVVASPPQPTPALVSVDRYL